MQILFLGSETDLVFALNPNPDSSPTADKTSFVYNNCLITILNVKSIQIYSPLISAADGIILNYNCADAISFAEFPDLLDVFADADIPTVLVACYDKTKPKKVEFESGRQLAVAFKSSFLEFLIDQPLSENNLYNENSLHNSIKSNSIVPAEVQSGQLLNSCSTINSSITHSIPNESFTSSTASQSSIVYQPPNSFSPQSSNVKKSPAQSSQLKFKLFFDKFIEKILKKQEIMLSRQKLLSNSHEFDLFKQKLLQSRTKRNSTIETSAHTRMVYPMPSIGADINSEGSSEVEYSEEVIVEGDGEDDEIDDEVVSEIVIEEEDCKTEEEDKDANDIIEDGVKSNAKDRSVDNVEHCEKLKKSKPNLTVDVNLKNARRISKRIDISEIAQDRDRYKKMFEDFGQSDSKKIIRDLESSSDSVKKNFDNSPTTPKSSSRKESDVFSSISIDRIGYSIDQLIVKMSNEYTNDIDLTKIFLMFYRKFMKPIDLLDRFMDRFDYYSHKPIPEDLLSLKNVSIIHPVQLKICNIVILWAGEYWEDFYSEKSRFTLQVFLEVLSQQPAFTPIVQRIAEIIFSPPPSREDVLRVDWGFHDDDDEYFNQNVPRLSKNFVSGSNGNVTLPGSPQIERSLSVGSLPSTLNSPISNLDVLFEESEPLVALRSAGWSRRHRNQNNLPSTTTPFERSRKRSTLDSTSGSVLEVFGRSSRNNRSSTLSFGQSVSFFSTSSVGSSSVDNSQMSINSDGNNNYGKSNDGGIGYNIPVDEFLVKFLEMTDDSIAAQLNLIEFEIFQKIKARDLVHHIWNRSFKGQHAPSVMASIDHFNFISNWVTSMVLLQTKLKNRVKVLSKFMRICLSLSSTNNYSTLMSLLAGINSSPLTRLKKTRELLEGTNAYKNYLLLEVIMGSERSFGRFRERLKRSSMPCIPYLGMFLRDLLYIDESGKDVLGDGNINLPKFLLMGDIVMMIQSFQFQNYHVKKDMEMINLLFGHTIMDEDECYSKSLELEPRTPR